MTTSPSSFYIPTLVCQKSLISRCLRRVQASRHKVPGRQRDQRPSSGPASALTYHENEIRYTYLREVLGQRIEPCAILARRCTLLSGTSIVLTEVVSQDWISHTDVACNSFIETSFGEDSVCCRKVLLPVQSLFFQGVKPGICSHFQGSSRFALTQSPNCGIVILYSTHSGCNGGHDGSLGSVKLFFYRRRRHGSRQRIQQPCYARLPVKLMANLPRTSASGEAHSKSSLQDNPLPYASGSSCLNSNTRRTKPLDTRTRARTTDATPFFFSFFFFLASSRIAETMLCAGTQQPEIHVRLGRGSRRGRLES